MLWVCTRAVATAVRHCRPTTTLAERATVKSLVAGPGDPSLLSEASSTPRNRNRGGSRGTGSRGWIRNGSRSSDGGDGSFELNAVFKVFATHCEPYYTMPWSTSPQTSSTASAFALRIGSHRCLLTNAHAVHHASLVELQRPGEDRKFLARVLCRGPDCDLALLDVDEVELFWEALEPLQLCTTLPLLNDRVRVCGYPVGGENLCMTEGIVSRIDLQTYSHGLGSLLALQIDAAINAGNSGGPVFDARRRCVGVAFQSLKDGDTENVGYVIPAEVIQHFVSCFLRFGRYAGFGHHGFSWQPLNCRAMREAVGAKEGGVLVKRVEPTTPAAALLRDRDVLLAIGDRSIGSGGTVPFRRKERIAFPYVTSRLCPGDTVPIRIQRDGFVHSWDLELAWPQPLVPMHPPQPPEYLIFGAIVFVPLSEPYLRSEWGDLFEERAPISLIEPWLRNVQRFPGEEIVVLSCVFASPLTAGLTHLMNRRLLRCDGESVQNLRHLAQLLDEGSQPSVLFELDDEDVVALPRLQAHSVTAQVLTAHLVPAARRLLLPNAAEKLEERSGDMGTL